jgi:hypothetical protein
MSKRDFASVQVGVLTLMMTCQLDKLGSFVRSLKDQVKKGIAAMKNNKALAIGCLLIAAKDHISVLDAKPFKLHLLMRP